MWEQEGALVLTGKSIWQGRKGTEKVANPGLSVLGEHLKRNMRWEMPPTASVHPPPRPACLPAVVAEQGPPVLPTTLPVTHCHSL